MRSSSSTLFLAIAILVVGVIPAAAHDAPHGIPVTPGERIDPAQVYPFAVVAGGGGHFHVLDVVPGGRRIFAGTHLGLFVSDDRGLTWRLAARRFDGVDVHALARNPRTGVLYAATHGHGVLVSRDGGARWQEDSPGSLGRDLHALALDPQNPQIIYVWSVGQGLFVRRDKTRAWERLAGATVLADVESLAVHPEDQARLYAGTARGVFISDDGGRRWTLPSGGLTHGTAGIAIAPHRPGMIFAATLDGVFVGRTDGTGWKQVEPSPSWWGPIVGFTFIGADPDMIFAVAHEGPIVTRHLDGGVWTPFASNGSMLSPAAIRAR